MLRLRRSALRRSIASVIAAVGVGVFAVSCGGGSGGGGGSSGAPSPAPPAPPSPPSPAPPGPPAPTNASPVVHSVYGGSTPLSISAPAVFSVGVQATDPDNDPLTYQWTQTAGPAASIRTPQSDYSLVDVNPPPAGQTVELRFRCRVSDGKESVDSPEFVETVTGLASGAAGPAITVTSQDMQYDELGRLVEVSLNNGAARIRYDYDADGNLISREVVR